MILNRNIAKIMLVTAIVGVLAITASIVRAEGEGFIPTTGGGDDNGAFVPGSNGGDEDGAVVPGSNGGNEGGAVVPGNGGSNNDEVGNTDSITNPPVTTGGGSSGRNSSKKSATSTPSLTDMSKCEYIGSYLKLGGANSSEQVTKLQTFLKNTEGLNVDINGNFDQKTLDAVKAFQTKYLSEIMLPWGVTTPTGQVFFTTKKKINEIYCKSVFALSPEQIAQIEAYKKGLSTDTSSDITSTTTSTSTEVGSIDSTDQTASAGNITILSRFMNFIKWLFNK